MRLPRRPQGTVGYAVPVHDKECPWSRINFAVWQSKTILVRSWLSGNNPPTALVSESLLERHVPSPEWPERIAAYPPVDENLAVLTSQPTPFKRKTAA